MAALELEGRVKYIGPIISGQSARGEWKKRVFVISTMEQFPRDVAFVAWKDRAEALDQLKVGQRVLVRFSLESRQHPQDPTRWFTDARAWAVKVIREEDVMGRSMSTADKPDYTNYPAEQSEPFPEQSTKKEEVEMEMDEPEDLMDEEMDEYEDLMEQEMNDLEVSDDVDNQDLFEKDQEDDLPF